MDALSLAIKFHETYERLAPSFGYETRKETRAFDPSTPNGRLMVAVCGEIITALDFPDGVCYHGVPLELDCPQCAAQQGHETDVLHNADLEDQHRPDSPFDSYP